MRTVRRQTRTLNAQKEIVLHDLCQAYAKEKNYWLDVLRSEGYQSLLGSPRTIRDQAVKDGYKSSYGLQARQWKLALQDAVETWDKYWQSLFAGFSQEMDRRYSKQKEHRHYAYYLLKDYARVTAMLSGEVPEPPFVLKEAERIKVCRFLQKKIRKLRGKLPRVKKTCSVKFDADCYEVIEEKGKQYLKVMTLVPRKRLVIPLLGLAKIEGNITIIFTKGKVEIHVTHAIKSSKQSSAKEKFVAVDFGYTEVMTDMEGTRYGEEFGSTLTKTSDELSAKMQKRHKLYAEEKMARSTNPRKAKSLRRYNLGRKKFDKKVQRSRAHLECQINTSIHK